MFVRLYDFDCPTAVRKTISSHASQSTPLSKAALRETSGVRLPKEIRRGPERTLVNHNKGIRVTQGVTLN